MMYAGMLVVLAGLVGFSLLISLFIPVTETGGALFWAIWPYQSAAIAILIGFAAIIVRHARRKPDAWIHRSKWPKVMAVTGFGLIVGVFGVGSLI